MKQEEDPALAPFLQVLDHHISAHPEQLQPMTMDLVARLDDLVGAVDVDLDAPLDADTEDVLEKSTWQSTQGKPP